MSADGPRSTDERRAHAVAADLPRLVLEVIDASAATLRERGLDELAEAVRRRDWRDALAKLGPTASQEDQQDFYDDDYEHMVSLAPLLGALLRRPRCDKTSNDLALLRYSHLHLLLGRFTAARETDSLLALELTGECLTAERLGRSRHSSASAQLFDLIERRAALIAEVGSRDLVRALAPGFIANGKSFEEAVEIARSVSEAP